MSKQFYVYILANRSRTLYIGFTNDLERRVHEHKRSQGSIFTTKYNVNKLVYYETYTDAHQAIAREKQLKGYLRRRKIELIEQDNPEWNDLSIKWYV